MMESAETQIAGLWGLSSPTGSTAGSTPEAPKAPGMTEAKTKPAKFRKQEKGGGKGQVVGRKRQDPPEEDDAGDQILVSRSELSTIRALLVRHDQALNQLAGSGLHDHGHVDRSHAEDSDQPLEGPVHERLMHDHTQGSPAHESVVGDGSKAQQVRAGPSNPQEKKAMITDQPRLSSDELKAAIKTLKAAAMTDGVIHKFAPTQKLGENITAQAVVFTLVLLTRARAERVHTEMTKLINSAATSLIGLRLRPERLQLSPLAKALAGPRS